MIDLSGIKFQSRIRVQLHEGTYADWRKNNFTRATIDSSINEARLRWGLNDLGTVHLIRQNDQIHISAPATKSDPPELTYTLTVEIGSIRVADQKILSLNPGMVLPLCREARLPLALYAENALVASCETVVIDDAFGIRVMDVYDGTKPAPAENVPGEGPTTLRVILGRCQTNGHKISALETGHVLRLDTVTGSPFIVEADGIPLFTATILVIDEEFALRVKEIIYPRMSASPEEMNDLFDMEAEIESDMEESENVVTQENNEQKECETESRFDVLDDKINSISGTLKDIRKGLGKLEQSIMAKKSDDAPTAPAPVPVQETEPTTEINLLAMRVNQLIDTGSIPEASSLVASLERSEAIQAIKMIGEETARKLIVPLSSSGLKPEDARESFNEWALDKTQPKGGPRMVRQLFEGAFGNENAVDMINRASSGLPVRASSVFTKVTPQRLYSVIRSEHPQTIALIMNFLPSESAAMLLQEFDAIIQNDIARRIASLRPVDKQYIREIERVLERKIFGLFDEMPQSWPKGIETLSNILQKSDPVTEKFIVETLEETDPEIAAELKKKEVNRDY